LTTYFTWTTNSANTAFTYTVSRQTATGPGPYNYDNPVSPAKTFTSPYTLNGSGDSLWAIETYSYAKSGGGTTAPPTPTPAVANYAPPSLAAGAVIAYTGTTVDSLEGTSNSSFTFRTTSSSAFPGGTYTYVRTGPTSAQIKYTLVATSAGSTETETGTVNLVFTSATRASYSSTGSYNGVYQGSSYRGTFTGSGSATYSPPAGAPQISVQPTSQVAAVGGTATLSAAAAGATGYQWQKDGTDLAGKTSSTITLANLQSTDAGAYTALISNGAASILSDTVTLMVGASPTGPGTPTNPGAPASRLANLSVRTSLARAQTLIVGFTVSGGSKPILVRAAGPALGALGLTGFLPDPGLELYRDSALVKSNDDWPSALSTTFASVGAFAFSSGSYDAAFLENLSGGYSAWARSVTAAGTGTVLVEAYDAGSGSAVRLTNLSARNRVGTGNDILIAGFFIAGTGTQRVLIRAVGPSLAAFGLTGLLTDPKLEIYNAAGAKIAENDNWDATLSSTFASAGAFALMPGGKDAALIVSLPAGATYTVQVKGADGGTGEGLIEVYELP
jgi:hypothetical protein